MELSDKMDWINTIDDAKKLLEDVEKEIAALKEYKQFKELLSTLEEKVEELRKKYTQPFKKELADLQKKVVTDSNISPEQIKKQAKIWRENAKKEIEEWIVAKLAQWNGWIARIAQKALWKW
jgi:chromatin segregation and condensation protein Rec8/ScpA/Scc1 (kleisin family)